MDGLRRAYLDAMEIPVWVSRFGGSRRLQLGPGSAPTLLLCETADQAATPLAADIERMLPESPVWAWPSEDDAGVTVERAVDEHLFSNILVFGDALAQQVFGRNREDSFGPARLIRLPSFAQLLAQAEHRRQLWQAVSGQGLVAGT